MKRTLAVLAACTLAARVQACCDTYGDGSLTYVKDLNFEKNPPLTPQQTAAFTKCVDDHQATIQQPPPSSGRWIDLAKTWPGDVNIFGCNADHCYGDSNCQGTLDGVPYYAQQSQRWKIAIREWNGGDVFACPALQNFYVTGYSGTCPSNPGRRLTQSAAEVQAARLCADREQVLNEPLTQTAARLSQKLCEPGGDVGLTFAGAVLASLDADKNGEISCLEYGIAKTRTTLAELNGTYLGPSKLPAPFCKLSKSGAAYLARYNKYILELTLGTLKNNATGLAVTTAQRAAAKVEAAVVGNAAVGKVLDVTDKVAAKLNVTLLPGL